MEMLLKIAGLIFKETGSLMLNDFYWIMLIIIIFMYRRTAGVELTVLGKQFPMLEKLSGSVLLGMMGGLVGSLLVVFMGITIESYTSVDQGALYSGILYLWVIAILLAFIDPRYLCFSYAGGIVAMANLLTGFPNIYAPGLLALIGILHLIESFLIWLDGYTYAVPLFIKRKNGEIVGGFMMNKMWAIPLLILGVGVGATASGGSLINSLMDSAGKMLVPHMPEWWPLVKQPGLLKTGMALAYMPLLVPVVLGYGDMAITRSPEKRCSDSAQKLALYSVILIALAAMASVFRPFGFAAAVFAPAAHEFLIVRGKREEEEGIPFYGAAEEGIRVLYPRKGSPSDKMKLKPGEIILSINNMPLNYESQLTEFLSQGPSYIWMNIKDCDGKIRTVEYRDYSNGVTSIGALIVSRNTDLYFEINEERASLIKRIIRRFRRK